MMDNSDNSSSSEVFDNSEKRYAYLGEQPNGDKVMEAIRKGLNPFDNPELLAQRWEDEVDIDPIINRRVVELDPLPTPASVLKRYPLTEAERKLIVTSRNEIRRCLYGEDDRLLVIVGPCSVHDSKAALVYARKLSRLSAELKDRLLIIMRVYFEKPRTTVGWKGLINDPDIDGTYNIRKVLILARKILLEILGTGLPTAAEFLDPTSPQYTSDAVSWGAIGARNTESQIHRQLASGLSMPVGFKNATDGSVQVAIDGCFTAAQSHTFFGVDHRGRAAAVETLGNPDCHIVLRGSNDGPNYDVESVANAMRLIREELPGDSAATHGVIIDVSHGNSGKDEHREIVVTHELAARIASGENDIRGIMMESFLVGGHQKPAPLKDLVFGQSITDGCLSWDDTESLLRDLAEAVDDKRNR
jgi:3-deoxy-7-phosphoheptulonate synthase